jgi:hypothetical protein
MKEQLKDVFSHRDATYLGVHHFFARDIPSFYAQKRLIFPSLKCAS